MEIRRARPRGAPQAVEKVAMRHFFEVFIAPLAPTARPGSYAGKRLLRKAFCGFAVNLPGGLLLSLRGNSPCAAKSDESRKGPRSFIRQRFLVKLGRAHGARPFFAPAPCFRGPSSGPLRHASGGRLRACFAAATPAPDKAPCRVCPAKAPDIPGPFAAQRSRQAGRDDFPPWFTIIHKLFIHTSTQKGRNVLQSIAWNDVCKNGLAYWPS